jgi:hypothetical protein
VASGAFWLWKAGTLTTFIGNGFECLAMLLRTGHVDRLDVLIAAPAACVTSGLVVFCLWGYFRIRDKSWTDLGLFLVTFGVVALFFVAIFAAFAPQYLGMFKHLLGTNRNRQISSSWPSRQSALRPSRRMEPAPSCAIR